MKRIILCIAWVSCAFVTNAQNTGIGTTTPVARLHVTDSNVVFTGPSTLGATTLYPPPIQGAGSRMMWYPQKAAFRAGIVNGPQWDKDNIGRFSFAVGSNSWATGEGSFATGSISEARGDLSTAMGTSYASGQNSTALGNSNASGPYSTALGVSFASGESSTAAGYSSASGNFAFAGGASHAIAPSSTAFGYDTWAKAGGGVALGVFNDISDNPNPNVLSPTDRLFQIGNGSGSVRSNALTILRNGNAGIGTTNPGVRFHVSGGASGGAPYGGAQLAVENLNHTYISMISPDAFETGIILGKTSSTVSGGIFYNNSSTLDGLQFRTNGNQTRMVINDIGNIGIGINSPFSPLTFNNNLGEKISFYGNTSNNYGIGLQGGLLQIHSGAAGDDIAFGYGSSTSFTETMRIKGNGNVGIGIDNPFNKLDVNGRIRIRTGTDGEPGVWLNNTANTAIAAFVGMENDNYVGLYGGATGWKFAMNTNTGALKINGSEGQAGQVITSNGSASPNWASSTNALYNNTFIVNATQVVTTVTPPNSALIPGLTSTFSLAGNARVMVQFNVIATTTCSNCFGDAYIEIFADGNKVKLYTWRILSQCFLSLTGSHLLSLGPGTHTISIQGGAGQVTVQFGFNSSLADWRDTMIIQIIPE